MAFSDWRPTRPVENQLLGGWEAWVNVWCYVIGEKRPPHPQVFSRNTGEKVMFLDGKSLGGEGASALKRLGAVSEIFNRPSGRIGF